MKRFAMLFLVCVVAGCATLYPPPTEPVCSRPEAMGSVICATATRLNLTPEQIDAAFLDASLVGIGTEIVASEDLRKVIKKTHRWVTEQNILTIDGLVKYLVNEAEFNPALALLLSRRLGLINLPDLGVQPVTAYDRELILAGIQHQLDQLSWF